MSLAQAMGVLQAKSPIVEELQDHMMGLQQHRGQVAAENSAGNDREEMAPAEAAVQAALGVLSRSGPSRLCCRLPSAFVWAHAFINEYKQYPLWHKCSLTA